MEVTRSGSVFQTLNISSWAAFSVRKSAVADRWLEGMLLRSKEQGIVARPFSLLCLSCESGHLGARSAGLEPATFSVRSLIAVRAVKLNHANHRCINACPREAL